MSAFDIFQSRQNRDVVRELIAKQIEDEYGQKIGRRYDPLMDDVMKHIMENISEEVPKGMTRESYVVLMNKKLISKMMPTMKANAVKEKPKTMNMKRPPTGRMTYMEDPQEALRNRGAQETHRRREVEEVFDLPLEDMSRQEPMGPPRASRMMSTVDDAYQKLEEERRFRPPVPPPTPKFTDDVMEDKNPEKSLSMFNQLVKTYDEMKEEDPSPTPAAPAPKRKIYLKKTAGAGMGTDTRGSMSTPIEALQQEDASASVSKDTKIMDLLSPPFTSSASASSALAPQRGAGGSQGVSPHLPFEKKIRKVYLHLDSRMRNFEYHPEPISMRVYLSPYFQEEDEYVYLHMKSGYSNIMAARTLRYPKLNVAPLPTLKGCKEVHLEGILVDEDCPKVANSLFLQCGPVISLEEKAFAPIYSNAHHGIQGKHFLQWNPQQNRYLSIGETKLPVHIDNLQKNGYLRMHLYGTPAEERDYTEIQKMEVSREDDSEGDLLTLHTQTQAPPQVGEILYLYSHGYGSGSEEAPFMEWEDPVFIESMERRGEAKDHTFCVRAVLAGEEPVPFKFESHLRGILRQIESHEHARPDIFYLTLRLADGKDYFCEIVGFEDEEEPSSVGILCRHPKSEELMEKYADCVAWGLTKKNLQGGEETMVRVEGVLLGEEEREKRNKIMVRLLPNPARLPSSEIPNFTFFIQKKYQKKYLLSLLYEEDA